MVCAVQGVAWEVDARAPLTIAEVGCGTGYTAQMLAAGNPHWQVMGLDYNPAHIAEARSMAAAADLKNVQFLEADLADMDGAALDALPEFDLITVHGMWSWVADSVREGLLRLARRRLKPGGLVLLSYNALPGAAGSQGLSRVVRMCLDAQGGTLEGLAVAGTLVKRLVATEPAHLPNSAWRQMLTGEFEGARPGYLLHEFSTEHWRPSFQADVAAAMGTARCDFAGSATLDENFPHMSLSADQRALWEEAADPVARELIFDLCVKRPFRRDLYVRGLRRVPRDPAVDALWLASADCRPGERILLTQLGQAQLPQAAVDGAQAALASGPKQVRELRAQPGCEKVTPSELVALLVGSGCAVPLWCAPDELPDAAAAVAAARRLNMAAAARLAHFGTAPGQFGLAAAAMGGGMAASAMELVVAAQIVGLPRESVQADLVARQVMPAGQLHPEEVVKNVTQAVEGIIARRWPAWRALGIV
jgi:SAM-dependent methyltransferase